MNELTRNTTLFFDQWDSLFGEQTFDSFQVRYSTPLSILSEIETALEVVHSAPTAFHNINDLLDEAKTLFASDPVIPKKYRHEYNILISISATCEEKQSEKIIKKISCDVKIIKAKLGSYCQTIIDEIESVFKSNENQTFLLRKLINCLGSQLMQQGFSMPYLRTLFVRAHFQEQKMPDFISYFVSITSSLPKSKRTYSCYANTLWGHKITKITEGTNIEIITHPHQITATPEYNALLTQNPTGKIIAIKTTAYDKHGACLCTIESIKRVAGLFHFYTPSAQNAITIAKSIIVEDSDNKVRDLIENNYCWRQHIQSAKEPHKQVHKLLLLKSSSFKDWVLLENSLQYHSLAVQADTDEARLLNLWIALESLLPRSGESIIASISNIVPVVIASTYTKQLCIHLANKIKRNLYSNNESTRLMPFWMDRSWCATSGRKTIIIDTHDILAGLTDVNNGDKIKSLFLVSENEPLLLNQLYDLWKNQFQTRVKFKARIEKHQNNIKWQIRRIYRARNHLMHNGRSPMLLSFLVKNLQTYYIQIIHTIIFDLKSNNFDSVEQALSYRIHGYNHLLKLLSSSDEITTLNLLNTCFDHTREKHLKIWDFQQEK